MPAVAAPVQNFDRRKAGSSQILQLNADLALRWAEWASESVKEGLSSAKEAFSSAQEDHSSVQEGLSFAQEDHFSAQEHHSRAQEARSSRQENLSSAQEAGSSARSLSACRSFQPPTSRVPSGFAALNFPSTRFDGNGKEVKEYGRQSKR
jgi:hypothetical protein